MGSEMFGYLRYLSLFCPSTCAASSTTATSTTTSSSSPSNRRKERRFFELLFPLIVFLCASLFSYFCTFLFFPISHFCHVTSHLCFAFYVHGYFKRSKSTQLLEVRHFLQVTIFSRIRFGANFFGLHFSFDCFVVVL